MFLAHQQTRLGFLRLAWRLIRRKVDHGRDVIVSTPRRVIVGVRGRRRIAVALDGEKLRMDLPLKIRLSRPQAACDPAPKNRRRKIPSDDPPFAPVRSAFRRSGRPPGRTASGLAAEVRPDATLVSGDLTSAPVRPVCRRPGLSGALGRPDAGRARNHDMPLHNPGPPPDRALRQIRPRLRACAGAVLSLPDAVIQGVNTANPCVWKAGVYGAPRLTGCGQASRPLIPRSGASPSCTMPRWLAADGTPADIADPGQALADLAAAGAQIVLSANTHTCPIRFCRYGGGGPVPAGRHCDLDPPQDRRERFCRDRPCVRQRDRAPVHRARRSPFAPAPPVTFRRSDRGWQAASARRPGRLPSCGRQTPAALADAIVPGPEPRTRLSRFFHCRWRGLRHPGTPRPPISRTARCPTGRCPRRRSHNAASYGCNRRMVARANLGKGVDR